MEENILEQAQPTSKINPITASVLNESCQIYFNPFLLCRIYVKDLLALGVEKGTAELQTQKYRVVNADKSYRGEIQVGVTFTLKVIHTFDDWMIDA